MRHGKKLNHLGRKSPHRKAMMKNMASSLLIHKRITTTVAKAKALKVYVEPLITRGKEDTTHNRRMSFRYLRDKVAVQELFGEISAKVGDRPGGYTRILRTGNRLGDNAEMCIIELVDFNDTYVHEKKKTTRRSRRRRGGGGGESTAAAPAAAAVAQPEAPEAPAEEEVADEPEAVAKAPEVEDAVEEAAVEEAAAEEVASEEPADAAEAANEESAPESPEEDADENEKKDA